MTKHSKNRAMERYNLDLTYSDEKKILKLINEGNCIFLDADAKEPDKIFVYLLYKNIPLKLLYVEGMNGEAAEIITAYPFNVEEYNEVSRAEFNAHLKNAIKFLQKNGYIVFKRGKLKKNF